MEMATIQMVRDVLMPIGVPVYHMRAPEMRPDQFLIWGESRISFTLDADDEPEYAETTGQIYYYTTAEYDTAVNKIISALLDGGIRFTIGNVGYSSELRMIVYEIDWSIDCGAREIY